MTFNDIDFNSLISALFGASFTLFAVFIAEFFTRKRQKDDNKKQIINFLNSICAELNTLWKLYYENAGQNLEECSDTEAYTFVFIVNQDYFTIYRNNSHIIGQIDNEELRSCIIRAYAKAKSLIDTYQLNNSMLEKKELFLVQKYKEMYDEYEHILKEYTTSLKRLHFELKDEIDIFNKLLENKNS